MSSPSKRSAAWRSLTLLLRSPSEWSARWYREKSSYDSVAVRSDLDRQRDPEEAPRRHDRLKQSLARYLSELGWGDERYEDPR